jgi:hypothetical protein
MDNAVKVLSSSQTFVMKVVFPVLWISFFGFGTLSAWRGTMQMKGGGQPPPETKWMFLGGWIAGTTFILWTGTGLKRVCVDSKNLYVSNYRREIVIPLTMVGDVTENRWTNINPVTIHLRNDTEFGQKITFMPTSRFFGWWSPHPVVAELEQMASIARATSRSSAR